MKIMLTAFIMMCFVGAGLLKLAKTDPSNTQNIITTTAHSIAENAFYYVNTALQYAADNSIAPSDKPLEIKTPVLDIYMLDSKTRTAEQTFELLSGHVAYVAESNNINYILVSWNPFVSGTNPNPIGIAEGNYIALNDGLLGELTRLVNQENQRAKNSNIKNPTKYLPYVVGYIPDIKNQCDNFQVYSAETVQIDEKSQTRLFKDIFAELCKSKDSIKNNLKPYIMFRQITIQ